MEAEVNALRGLQDHFVFTESILPCPIAAQLLGIRRGCLINLPVQALDLLQNKDGFSLHTALILSRGILDHGTNGGMRLGRIVMNLKNGIQWLLQVLNEFVIHSARLVRFLSRKGRIKVTDDCPCIGSFELLQTAGQMLECGRATLGWRRKLKPLNAYGGFLDLKQKVALVVRNIIDPVLNHVGLLQCNRLWTMCWRVTSKGNIAILHSAIGSGPIRLFESRFCGTHVVPVKLPGGANI